TRKREEHWKQKHYRKWLELLLQFARKKPTWHRRTQEEAAEYRMNPDGVHRPRTQHEQHENKPQHRVSHLAIALDHSAELLEQRATDQQHNQSVGDPATDRLYYNRGAATKARQHDGQNTPRRSIIDCSR